ncbi:hypothetical protein LINGRAHAP2_LOCUS32352 [Linum grandiflorum]
MADDEWDDSSSEDADYEPSVDQTETESKEDKVEGVDGSVHGGNEDSEVRSSYRASSQSDHVIDDKVDGEEVSSLDRQAYYDPKCDHKYLVFREGLKFTSPSEFKDAIINYSISVGADIRWSRSNKKNKEAVCAFESHVNGVYLQVGLVRTRRLLLSRWGYHTVVPALCIISVLLRNGWQSDTCTGLDAILTLIQRIWLPRRKRRMVLMSHSGFVIMLKWKLRRCSRVL